MGTYTSGDLVRRFAELEGKANGLARAYLDLVARCEMDVKRYEADVASAGYELAAAYLPTLDDDDLARAERLSGFRGRRALRWTIPLPRRTRRRPFPLNRSSRARIPCFRLTAGCFSR